MRWHLFVPALTSCLVACSAAGQLAAPDIGSECNTPPDGDRPQYVIGYGSLMQDDSRKRTSPGAGPAHPVEISGYRRGWFARGKAPGFGTTYLGVLPDRASHLNAVIYRVDLAELVATDKRESSYCRTRVAIPDIKPLEREYLPAQDAQAWIYVSRPQSVAAPDSRNPIVQSYVDIFVSGCLEQEQRLGLADFSQQCLSTTADWSEHWVNDRIYPRRPFIFQPRAAQIDTLLSRQLPQYFSRIRIESGG
jgi:cation transport regulator ChaC